MSRGLQRLTERAVAGRLPLPVANAAAATAGGTGYMLGGLWSAGTAFDSIVRIGLAAG